MRYAILARNPQELEATLADIADKRKTIAGAMEGLCQGMFDDEGRQAFVPLQGLVNEFWKVGEENLRLIQDGKKDEAFAFLVDRTIPARNKILAVLDGEKKRQSQRLSLTINEVKSLAAADRNIAVAVMVLVVACLSGLGLYLRAVVRDLGADPPDLKRVALAVANGDLGVEVLTREGAKSASWRACATCASASPKWWAPFARVQKACLPRAVKSLRATTICPPAPSSRPQRCSKQPRRWTKWVPPCARTPKAPAVPTSSPRKLPGWQSRVARW